MPRKIAGVRFVMASWTVTTIMLPLAWRVVSAFSATTRSGTSSSPGCNEQAFIRKGSVLDCFFLRRPMTPSPPAAADIYIPALVFAITARQASGQVQQLVLMPGKRRASPNCPGLRDAGKCFCAHGCRDHWHLGCRRSHCAPPCCPSSRSTIRGGGWPLAQHPHPGAQHHHPLV